MLIGELYIYIHYSMKYCIVTLVDNKNLQELEKLFESLNSFFVINNPDFDFLIFHEDGFLLNHELKLNNNGKIILHKVDFSLDQFAQHIKNEIPTTFYGCNLGYRMMCRFFSGELFKILKSYNYEYVLRLDTDSSFYEVINRNIFDEFKSKNAKYGYISITNDRMEFRTNLLESVIEYIKKYNTSTNLSTLDTIRHQYNLVYYTNFEMFKLSEFISDNYLNFYNFLDSKMGFLRYRWGDHAVRFLYVNLYIPQSEIYYFNDIAYKHSYLLKNKPFQLVDWNL